MQMISYTLKIKAVPCNIAANRWISESHSCNSQKENSIFKKKMVLSIFTALNNTSLKH